MRTFEKFVRKDDIYTKTISIIKICNIIYNITINNILFKIFSLDISIFRTYSVFYTFYLFKHANVYSKLILQILIYLK